MFEKRFFSSVKNNSLAIALDQYQMAPYQLLLSAK